MIDDIRDKPYIDHKDVLGLNFIKDPGIYIYRRHYRQGLRSHIMEVLDPKDVENETKGIIIDGLKLSVACCVRYVEILVGVHGFKGSEVQGSILVPGLHLEYVFMRKASSSSCLIQNLYPN